MSDAAQVARLQTLAKNSPLLFRDYIFPDGPVKNLQHVGILRGNSLRVFGIEDSTEVEIYSAQLAERPDFNLGFALPPGMAYFPGRTLRVGPKENNEFFHGIKVISETSAGFLFAQIVPRDEQGKPTLLSFRFVPTSGGKLLPELVKGAGLLFYNASPRPIPKDVDEEDDVDLHPYQIRFVDLCVNEGLLHVRQSRARIEELETISADPDNAKIKRLLKRLKDNADQYRRLQRTADFFKYLSYMLTLSKVLAAGLPAISAGFSGGPAAQKKLEKELIKLVPLAKELEKKLVISGKPYTIDEFRKLIEKRLRTMRKGAPLLGRLSWEDIKGDSSNAAIVAKIHALAKELKNHNSEADEKLQVSTERIRTALGGNTLLPIPVLHIPRIIEPVKKSEDQAMFHDGFYRLAVVTLEANQAAIPLVLAAAEIVFGFFCPPIAILLGIFSAVNSADEAKFKRALADADVSVDTALVSQGEADDAEFWAMVDKIFVAVDLGGPAVRGLRGALKGLKGSDELAEAAQAASKLTDLEDAAPLAKQLDAVDDGADAAKALDKLAETADVVADEARISGALDTGLDAKKGHQAAKKARADGVSLDGPKRVDADTELDDALRQIDDDFKKGLNDEQFEQIVNDYRQYFSKRRKALDNGADLPQPRRFPEFAVNRKFQLIEPDRVAAVSATHTKRQARRRPGTLLEWLSGKQSSKRASAAEMTDLLQKPAEFRKRLKQFVKRKNLRDLARGMTRAERELIRDVVAAGNKISDAQLDELIDDKIARPLREQAAKYGDDLAFATFLHRAPHAGSWSDDGLNALKRLFDAVDEIDPDVLDFIVWQPRYREFGDELIRALDVLRQGKIDGAMKPVAEGVQLGGNRSIVQRLVSGRINRGDALEAIAIARAAPHAPPGSKIVAGKELQSAWLRSLQLEHGASGKGSIRNLIDADIFLQFPDGRRMMVDTKWVDVRGGRNITREEILRRMHFKTIWQIYKMDRAIAEGLVDAAEFWLSHHIVDDMFDVATLQALADRLSSGRIRIVSGVFEDPEAIRRGFKGSSLNPNAPPRPPPDPAAAVAKPPSVILPSAERQLPASPLTPPRPEPTIRSARVRRGRIPDPTNAELLVRGGLRSAIRLRHVTDIAERHEVRMLPLTDALSGVVEQFGLYRAAPGTVINGKKVEAIAANGADDGDLTSLRAELTSAAVVTPVAVDAEDQLVPYIYREPPLYLYMLGWRVAAADGLALQLWRFDASGVPHSGQQQIEVVSGWNVLPLAGQTALIPEGIGSVITLLLYAVGNEQGALSLELIAR